MVFALLIAAIIWNLGTWYLGLPASQLAHADRLDHRRRPREPAHARPTTAPAASTGSRRPRSASRCCSRRWSASSLAALLLLALQARSSATARSTRRPRATTPPPLWIRGAADPHLHRRQLRPRLERRAEGHGPDHADPDRHRADRLRAQPRGAGRRRSPQFAATSRRGRAVARAHRRRRTTLGDPRAAVDAYVRTQTFDAATVRRARRARAATSPAGEQYGSLRKVPAAAGPERPQRHVPRVARRSACCRKTSAADVRADDRRHSRPTRSRSTTRRKFIPTWVKVAVAIALGLGTMVGWKRIVVTVGEKIGKSHLTYAQGASAELVAMATIGAADCSACRCRRRTCCPRASPAPWRPTAPACSGGRSAACSLAWVLTLPARSFGHAVLHLLPFVLENRGEARAAGDWQRKRDTNLQHGAGVVIASYLPVT